MELSDIKFRPYQEQCLTNIYSEYKGGIKNQLIKSATGTGKRVMAIFLASKFRRPLFIAHREELIMQAYDEFEKFFPMQTGIIKGSRTEDDKRFTVTSIQTMVNRYQNYPKDMFDCIIVDEAHHYMAPSYIKPLQHFQPQLLTGWTATPKRLDGLSLGNIFDKMVFDYGIEKGIEENWLAKIDAYRIQTMVDLSKVKRVAGDFNQRELAIEVNTRARNALIAQKIHKYWNGEPIMAFCVDIDHAYDLRDILREHGFTAEAVVSDTDRCPNRTEIVQGFTKGEFNVLTNVNMLTEGFDFADVGLIAMARPTQSESMYVQMVGRGTRLKSPEFVSKYGHNKCTILDFVDVTQRHSLVNCYELEKNKPVEQRIFISDKDRELIMEEKRKRTMKLMTFYGDDHVVDLLKLPEMFISKSPKMMELATPKQIDFMKKLGVWQDNMEYTKRDASELIGSQPVQMWQMKKLADLGYDVMNGATISQFQQVMQANEPKDKPADKYKLENPDIGEVLKRLKSGF